MPITPAGTFLMKMGQEAGFTPYDVHSGYYATSKLARFRTASGRPVVIQINNKVPRVWLRTEHVTPRLAALGGNIRHYAAAEPRHHHLDQVREFRNQRVTKIEVKATDPLTIRAAFGGS